MLMSFRYFALNKLRIKRKKCFKFDHLLILLSSGDVSLNSGPGKNLPDNDKFKPFHKCSLHFFHINVNSLLSKIDELRNIAKPKELWKALKSLSLPSKKCTISNICLKKDDKICFDDKTNTNAFKEFFWIRYSVQLLSRYFRSASF